MIANDEKIQEKAHFFSSLSTYSQMNFVRSINATLFFTLSVLCLRIKYHIPQNKMKKISTDIFGIYCIQEMPKIVVAKYTLACQV